MKLHTRIISVAFGLIFIVFLLRSNNLQMASAASHLALLAPTATPTGKPSATPTRADARSLPTVTPQPKSANQQLRASQVKAPAGNNVWTSIGPFEGFVSALAIDPQTPSTIYAATEYYGGGGVFKSTDGGMNWSWSWTNSALTTDSVLALAIDPQTPSTIYAGAMSHYLTVGGQSVLYTGGVFKSTNGGASWSAINSGLTNTVVFEVAVDPQTPSTIYAGTDGGVFKSTNGGTNWSAVNSGLTDTQIRALAIDPQSPSTLYSGAYSGRVFKSINGGASWTNIYSTSYYIGAIVIDPQTPTTVYAGTQGGVFRSGDGGSNWSAINSGLTNTRVGTLAIDPQTPSTIYAGTVSTTYGGSEGAVFKSTNGGASWTITGLSITVIGALAIAPQSPTTLYAGTNAGYGGTKDGDGVLKSVDGGTSWAAINNGLNNADVRVLAIDSQSPATIYAGTSYGRMFKSTNAGVSWSRSLTTTVIYALAIDPQTPSTVYAGTEKGGVLKSMDGGANWSSINSGLTNMKIWALAIDPQTPSTIYAGTDSGGVFKSTNGGASWSNIFSTSAIIGVLAINPQNPSTVYAGSGIIKSTDGGTSWVGTGLVDIIPRALVIDPYTPSTIYVGTSGDGIFKSSDAGVSWNAINNGLSNSWVYSLAIDPESPSTVYAGTEGSGIFKSTNGGANWVAMNSGLTSPFVYALAIDSRTPSTVYAATDGGGVFGINPPTTYSISGRVTDGSNGIPGVTISDGVGHTSPPADINGNYTLSGLPAGAYTLVASKTGYTFSASFIQPITVPPDGTGQNFVGVLTSAHVTATTAGHFVSGDPAINAALPISVVVQNAADNSPVPGASIRVANGNYILGITDSTGRLNGSLPISSVPFQGGFQSTVDAQIGNKVYSSALLTLYQVDLLAGSPSKVTSDEATYYPIQQLLMAQLAPDVCPEYGPAWVDGFCTVHSLFGMLIDILDHVHSFAPQAGDIATVQAFKYSASGMTPVYLYAKTYTRNSNVVYNEFRWTENFGLIQPLLGPNFFTRNSVVLKLGSPATTLAVDPNGKRIGYNPSTGTFAFDVPGAVSPTGAEPYLLVIPVPVTGQYYFQLTGTGTGTYSLDIQNIISNGQSAPVFHTTGQTSAGNTQTYQVTYSPNSLYLPLIMK